MAAGAGVNFAAEHAVDEDEIGDRDENSKRPPDETDGEGVIAGLGVGRR
jgi:hypothetical protein